MKDHRHFTRQCGSGTFEAEPFPQHAAPTAKRTFPTDSGQKHCGGFVKQSALAITTSRDVAVIINFSRLEVPRCDAEPGTRGAAAVASVRMLDAK